MAGLVTPATDGFREAIDWETGTISAQGRLTEQGADLIRGAALQLHRRGHSRITVDLHDLGFADEEGRAALLRLTERLRARSWEVVVLFEENLS
jgi:anti-anti-sigma regulatory factor